MLSWQHNSKAKNSISREVDSALHLPHGLQDSWLAGLLPFWYLSDYQVLGFVLSLASGANHARGSEGVETWHPSCLKLCYGRLSGGFGKEMLHAQVGRCWPTLSLLWRSLHSILKL